MNVPASHSRIESHPVAMSRGTTSTGIYYEVHGSDGPAVFLAFPVVASPEAMPGAGSRSPVRGFLERLTDRYQVLIVDYPSIGKSATVPAAELTIQRVCADLLSVADAAGFARFAWWGGTFGAIAGQFLAAAHPSRLSAFVSAGWPPLRAPYAAMLRGVRINLPSPPPHARAILRDPAQYAQWVTFYDSIVRALEDGAIAPLACPRLVIYGANSVSDVAGIPLNLAAIIRSSHEELEATGWRVVEVPGRDDALILEPEALVPPVRKFLDEVL